VRPPTTYIGGTTRLGSWTASLLPAHRTYVEPFCEPHGYRPTGAGPYRALTGTARLCLASWCGRPWRWRLRWLLRWLSRVHALICLCRKNLNFFEKLGVSLRDVISWAQDIDHEWRLRVKELLRGVKRVLFFRPQDVVLRGLSRACCWFTGRNSPLGRILGLYGPGHLRSLGCWLLLVVKAYGHERSDDPVRVHMWLAIGPWRAGSWPWIDRKEPVVRPGSEASRGKDAECADLGSDCFGDLPNDLPKVGADPDHFVLYLRELQCRCGQESDYRDHGAAALEDLLQVGLVVLSLLCGGQQCPQPAAELLDLEVGMVDHQHLDRWRRQSVSGGCGARRLLDLLELVFGVVDEVLGQGLAPGPVGLRLGLDGQGDKQSGGHGHGQLVEVPQILEPPTAYEYLALQRHPQRRGTGEADQRLVGLLASADDQPFALAISQSTSSRLIQIRADVVQCPWHLLEDFVAPHTDGVVGFHGTSSRRLGRRAGASMGEHERLGVDPGDQVMQVEYASEAGHRTLAQVLHTTSAAVLLSGYPSSLYDQLYAGWYRAERTVQRPASNVSGGRGAAAVEVLWSNRPVAAQLQLAVGAHGAVGRWSG
jgi:hypothetical protein